MAEVETEKEKETLCQASRTTAVYAHFTVPIFKFVLRPGPQWFDISRTHLAS